MISYPNCKLPPPGVVFSFFIAARLIRCLGNPPRLGGGQEGLRLHTCEVKHHQTETISPGIAIVGRTVHHGCDLAVLPDHYSRGDCGDILSVPHHPAWLDMVRFLGMEPHYGGLGSWDLD